MKFFQIKSQILQGIFDIHSLSLKFKDSSLESKFREKHIEYIIPLNRVALFLAFNMYTSFLFLDYYLVPESFFVQTAIRLIGSAFILISLLYSFFPIYKKYQEVFISVPDLLCGHIHFIMLIVSSLPEDYVRSALCLMLLYTYYFAGLRFYIAIWVAHSFVVVYILDCIVFRELDFFRIFYQSFWIISTNTIGILSAYVIEFVNRRSFVQGILIQQEKRNTEKAKNEIEKLNEVTKRINENSHLGIIIDIVFYYLEENFQLDNSILYLVNEKSNSLEYFRSIVSKSDPQELIQFVKENPISLNETQAPVLNRVIKSKKHFYLSRLNKLTGRNLEEKLTMMFELDSVLYLPLVAKNEVLAILLTSSKMRNIRLSKEEIIQITHFADQISGAVQNSVLLKETINARNQAEIEKGIAQVAQQETEAERQKSEKLLLNILPEEVALELKEKGFTAPVLFDSVTVLFTDFKGFTQIAENMSPNELVSELDGCFRQFDKITEMFKLEKLKTIGDSYMCVGGIPKINTTHAVDSILAALEIQAFMNQMKTIKTLQSLPYWELRLGIHTGPLIAGVIGEKKFAYDVWGDTVNIASRMESSGTPSMINISGTTYEMVKDFFVCEYRGKINAKNKGEIDMYYVLGVK